MPSDPTSSGGVTTYGGLKSNTLFFDTKKKRKNMHVISVVKEPYSNLFVNIYLSTPGLKFPDRGSVYIYIYIYMPSSVVHTRRVGCFDFWFCFRDLSQKCFQGREAQA